PHGRLAPGRGGPRDLVVSEVERRLDLGPGEGTHPRVRLELTDMPSHVPLMTPLHRVGPEPLEARLPPPIAGVDQVVAEHGHRHLVRADRRVRPLPRPQLNRPRLDIRSLPRPRVLPGELEEPLDRPHPSGDRRLRQHPSPLLHAPPTLHRRPHALLRIPADDIATQQPPRRRRLLATPVRPHPSTSLTMRHQMHISCTQCNRPGKTRPVSGSRAWPDASRTRPPTPRDSERPTPP